MHSADLPMAVRIENGGVPARGLRQIEPARGIDSRPGLEVKTAQNVILTIQGAPIVNIQWQAFGQRVQSDILQGLPADDFTALLPLVQGLGLEVMRRRQALVVTIEHGIHLGRVKFCTEVSGYPSIEAFNPGPHSLSAR